MKILHVRGNRHKAGIYAMVSFPTVLLHFTVPVTVVAVYAPTEPYDPSVKDESYKNLQNVTDSIPNSQCYSNGG